MIRTEDAPFTLIYFLSKLNGKYVLIPSYALGDKLFGILEELEFKKLGMKITYAIQYMQQSLHEQRAKSQKIMTSIGRGVLQRRGNIGH